MSIGLTNRGPQVRILHRPPTALGLLQKDALPAKDDPGAAKITPEIPWKGGFLSGKDC